MQVTNVSERNVSEQKVWDGVKELKTWEWEYGSSPEFSNLIEGELSFGSLVSTSFTVTVTPEHPDLMISLRP
jgi:lipoate-protein ligase A